MKLQDLLVEASKLSANSFPLLFGAISEKEQMWLNQYLTLIKQSLAAGEIVNPRYQEAKSYINRCLEHGYKNLISEKYFYAGKWESLPKDLYDKFAYTSYPQIHNVDGIIKKTEKLKKFKHPLVEDMMNYLVEIKPLCDSMLALKEMVVKKAKATIDKEQKEAAYKVKLASHTDVQRVREKLTEITKDVYESALEANKKWLLGVSEAVIKQMEETPKGKRVEFSPFAYFLQHVYTLITKEKGYEGGHSYSSERYLLPNYKSILDKEAKKITDEMMRQFIEKNTNKLAEIVSRKNNLKDIEIVNANTSKGVVEGTMYLTFKDGSKFTVVNKVVLSYSKYHKAFYRFPTTFHDVTFANGEKLNKPSEDRVIELFTK